MNMIRRARLLLVVAAIAISTMTASIAIAAFGGTASSTCMVAYQTSTGTYQQCSAVRVTTSSATDVTVNGRKSTTTTVCSVLVYSFTADFIYGSPTPLWSGSDTISSGSGSFTSTFSIPSSITGYVEINCWNGIDKWPIRGWSMQ
jgi:hypothetical protein